MQKTQRFDSHRHNLKRCHAKTPKTLKHSTPVSSELCRSPSDLEDPSLGTPGLSKLCPSPSDVNDLCFDTLDVKELTPPGATSSDESLNTHGSSGLCPSPSDGKRLSLGTLGSSKLFPSPSDVNDLCFDTLDVKELTPPAATSSDESLGTPGSSELCPSPSDTKRLSLGTPGLSKLCPSPSDVKYPSPLYLNKLSPSASWYDVNANADELPVSDYEESSSSEYTSEDEDEDSFQCPLTSYQYPFEDEVMSFKSSCDLMSPSVVLKVSQWADTWKELDVRAWTWIHVHAYYSKKKRHGGYGVIVCDALGKPIIAKANFSKTGYSFLHQVFKGISVGVELAEERGRDGFHVGCNSYSFSSFIQSFQYCTDSKCKNRCDPKYLCKACKNRFIVQHCGMDTAPFVQKLRQKKLSLNEPSFMAEHYIAKMEKKKILETKEESRATVYDGTVYFPDGFPQGLKSLVWSEEFAKTVKGKACR